MSKPLRGFISAFYKCDCVLCYYIAFFFQVVRGKEVRDIEVEGFIVDDPAELQDPVGSHRKGLPAEG